MKWIMHIGILLASGRKPGPYFSVIVRGGPGKRCWGLQVNLGGLQRMRRSHLLHMCLVVFLMAFCSTLAFSQAVNATVVGTVRDATGAVVVNAKVTLTEANTNVSHTGNTNESGNFNFADVPPGAYFVTVESPGFKKEVQRNIAVLVNTT